MTFNEWLDKEYGDKVGELGLVVPELMRGAWQAALESRVSEQDRIDARIDASNPDLEEIRAALNSDFTPVFPELQDAWPSPEDAAITACALMIKGICMTKPQDEWTTQIEKRIRFMLKGASK